MRNRSLRKEVGTGKQGKRKVQGVPQSQTAATPRHQEEEETDKTKQAQIEQTYEKQQGSLSENVRNMKLLVLFSCN